MTDPGGGTATATEEHLLSGYGGRLLLATSLGWSMVQGGRLVLSPLVPAVRADLALSNTEIGLVFTVMWAVYAVLQYPSGRLSDELSRKPLVVGGLLITAVGLALLGAAPSYPVFLLAAGVTGFGAGLFPTAARALISDLFVDKRGGAFGLHTGMGDTGGVVAAVLATLALAVSWRLAYTPVVVVMVAVALAIHVWDREPYEIGRVELGLGATFRRLLAEPALRRLLLAYILFSATWQSAVAFLPSFLQIAKGLPPGLANASFGALFVVGALVKPPAGWVGDRYGRTRVAAAGVLAGGAGLTVAVWTGWLPGVVAGVVVFAVGLMAYPPVVQAALMDAFPDESMGGDLGAFRSVYIGVASAGPTVVGAIADHAGFELGFTLLVGCMLVAGALLVAVSR